MNATNEARLVLFDGAINAAREYIGSAWEDVPLLSEKEFLDLRNEIMATLKGAYYLPRYAIGAEE